MANRQVPCYDDSIIEMSATKGIGYDFNCPEALLQRPVPRTRILGEAQASNKGTRPTVAEILSVLNPWWNTISIMACVIAVLMDPLFFYIPYIDDDKKCLGMDKELRNAALISRSLTDITFIVHIIYQIHTAMKTGAGGKSDRIDGKRSVWEWNDFNPIRVVIKNLSWGSFLTDILALLPIPQVLIVAVFFKMRGPRYLDDRKAVSFFILAQYLPRMYRIYLSSKKLRKSTAIWLKGAFNLFMYIIASHILGAFWYFFSIQRVTSCWHQTYCKTTQGCTTTYYCDDTALINIPLVNGSCPVSPTDTEKFDFGMFSDCLQSGNTGPTSFSVKLLYTLWWGLRNLSNFGTSLETSTYVWENFFAILISVVGLILFSYLIGNMQQCMQWEEEKKMGSDKFKLIRQNIENWMERNELEDDLKKEIMKTVKKKLEDDVDFEAANLENLFSILPWYTQETLQRVLCMNTLRKVPILFENLEEKVLQMICDYLKPVTYAENTVVFRMGEPLDRMVFITGGIMWTYTTASGSSVSMDANFLKKGNFYGRELLQFVSSSLAALPTSAANVKCHTNVDAFVLTAKDLRSIVARKLLKFNCNDSHDDADYNAFQDDAADQVAPQPRPFPQARGRTLSSSTPPATGSGENSP